LKEENVMNLNNRALMNSGGIGAGVLILLSLCSGTLLFLPLAGTDAATLVATLAPASIVLACCGWILYIGIGFAYVYFASQQAASVQVADGAIGGAIATAIAAILAGILSACLTLVAPFAISASSGVSADPGTIIAGSIGGVAGAICGGLFIGGILGAIGGLIGALTIGKPK
jgi:hypothetical protein